MNNNNNNHEPLYFSRAGYKKHLAKIDSLEKDILKIQSQTQNVAESEGSINDENTISESMQQATEVYRMQVQKYKKELNNSKIIIFPNSVDEVCIGCTVNIKLDGKLGRYDILGFGEFDIKQNKISYTAPIAQALLGQKPGYKAQVKICDSYKVVELLGVNPIRDN